MIEFKAGDRVKYTSGKHGDISSNPLWGGVCGHIVGTISSKVPLRVGWDNKSTNTYCSNDLEHVNIIPEEMFTL